MEEIEKVEEKEDFDVRIFRMALPMSLSRHWRLPWLRWNPNPSSYKADGSTSGMFTQIVVWSFWAIFTSGWWLVVFSILEHRVATRGQMEGLRFQPKT